MFSSEAAISRETSSSNTSAFMFSDNSSYRNFMGNEIPRGKDIAASYLFQQHNHQSGGMMRFRSAPSSFLAAMVDRGENSSSVNGGDGNFTVNDGSDTVFSSLLNGNGSGSGSVHNGNSDSRSLRFMKPGIAEEKQQQMKNESILVRQRSSEGFFSGFEAMGEVGNYRHSNGEGSSSTSGFSNHIKHSSSAQQSAASNNHMPTIAENESWNESSLNCLKRTQEGDFKLLSATSNGMASQNEEPRTSAPGLTRHLSMPKTAAEMVAMEKYLQFQQHTILCKIRAKRGCATHPRSIAERNRRTRISERMKKLNELFPNMDKQANTADMLDLAAEHIKDLQKQVQTLTDKREKCTCSRKAQP